MWLMIFRRYNELYRLGNRTNPIQHKPIYRVIFILREKTIFSNWIFYWLCILIWCEWLLILWIASFLLFGKRHSVSLHAFIFLRCIDQVRNWMRNRTTWSDWISILRLYWEQFWILSNSNRSSSRSSIGFLMRGCTTSLFSGSVSIGNQRYQCHTGF